GTMELLDESERSLIKGLIINKFRGDETLLDPGIEFLKARTGVPYLGTIPYIKDFMIDSEDSLAFNKVGFKGSQISATDLIDITVIKLDHISNFTDFDVFAYDPRVNLRYVVPGETIGETDCVIIPGSKSTIADLHRLKETGAAREVIALQEKGVPVIGICGGFQMLGNIIEDPDRVESDVAYIKGLGLLDCKTVMTGDKITQQVEAVILPQDNGSGNNSRIRRSIDGLFYGTKDTKVKGYEIHMGRTDAGPSADYILEIKKRGDRECSTSGGLVSGDGMVFGTYVHGIFDNDEFRNLLLENLKRRKGKMTQTNVLGLEVNFSENNDYGSFRQAQIDKLADTVEKSLDMEFIFELLSYERVSL
ncbi:MAG: cobyric acid synthase, partial [Rubrobacteridae bacterium]|nr:cobyric acid synthase [Rubrobacteridae bacterium]